MWLKKNDAGNSGNVKEVKDVAVKRAANLKGHQCQYCQNVQPSAVTVAAVVGVTLDNEATSDSEEVNLKKNVQTETLLFTRNKVLFYIPYFLQTVL